jgi:hypothetical protein
MMFAARTMGFSPHVDFLTVLLCVCLSAGRCCCCSPWLLAGCNARMPTLLCTAGSMQDMRLRHYWRSHAGTCVSASGSASIMACDHYLPVVLPDTCQHPRHPTMLPC